MTSKGIPLVIDLQQAWSYIALGSTLIADGAIACTIFYHLSAARKSAPTLRSRFMIHELVQMFIGTFAFTGAISLAILITFATNFENLPAKPSLAFECLSIIHQKIYAISFLYVLNSRPKIQARGREIPLIVGISTLAGVSDVATDGHAASRSGAGSSSKRSWHDRLFSKHASSTPTTSRAPTTVDLERGNRKHSISSDPHELATLPKREESSAF